MNTEAKNNEVVSNEETKKTSLIHEISRNGMIQPILYIERVDGKENEPKVANILKKNDMLHTAPMNASHEINGNLAEAVTYEPKHNEMFMFENIWKLERNQAEIYTQEATNYIIQHTFISFCAMLDNTGKNFRDIIDYLPIKRYVLEELNKSSRGSLSDINDLLYDFIADTSNNSFVAVYNSVDTIDNIDVANSKLQAYCYAASSQLAQLIYSKICAGCDKALTEYLLGVCNTPNIEFIIKAAYRYFNIKETEINARYEVYYRLNAALVHMIDILMKNFVTRMCDEFFIVNFFSSFNYIYAALNKQYIDRRNKKYEEERKQFEEKFNNTVNTEVTEF